MTKKDYIIIAKAIKETSEFFINSHGELTDEQVKFINVLRSHLMRDMALENPRFDSVKFETTTLPQIV